MSEGRPRSDEERDEGKRIENHPQVRKVAEEMVRDAQKSIAPKPKTPKKR